MDLMVEDVAELLKVSTQTVNRWVEEGKIPTYKINDGLRFNPKEIEAWVLQKQTETSGVAPLIAKPREKAVATAGTNQFSLYRAIHRGFVYRDVPGDTKEEVIKETMQRLTQQLDLDAEVLTEMLLDREKLMPTALNHGIAVPHTRDFLLDTHFDVVTVVYPKKLIDYEALDGQPVHTMFFLFACEDRRHLNLLAKVAHLASNESQLALLKTKPEKPRLLELIRSWEADL